MTRHEIQLIQYALHAQGIDPGPMDGLMGTRTRAAIAAYTAANPPPPRRTATATAYLKPLPSDELSTPQKIDMIGFLRNWSKNIARYNRVAARSHVPAPLIAALHWREAGGYADLWHRYLHQGDMLGQPALRVPSNIPVFQEWEPAAVHALALKDSIRTRLGITERTTDLSLLCDYAEVYNGLGYRRKNLPSPYVLSGTAGYEKGKYIADGKFDINAVDRQLGVLPMLRACGLS